MEVGEERDYIHREIIYLTLYCHHQNDSCIKVGSDESRFNVLLVVMDKVTRQCLQTTTFLKRKRAKAESNRGPSAYQLKRLTARSNRLTRYCNSSLLIIILNKSNKKGQLLSTVKLNTLRATIIWETLSMKMLINFTTVD